ncbi:MAG: A/G-specific adenine glycosylase [Puniceicoccales bacterium]|jgi:A/G-specific adenine glycosylase|nr:A/G-specific adenine glycosylase [Puniceicoccales bacterium]
MRKTEKQPLPLPFPHAKIETFQANLLAWFASSHRKMPWRDKPSLYATVISEFMLQQTQFETARPYFERWITRWPDFASLAAATETEVVKSWEGLGYYNRARNLHKLATRIASMPAPPRTTTDWLSLPGVGNYTAAAITSIAFNEPAAVVDGNVIRVLARLTAQTHEFKDTTTAAKHLAPLAQKLLTRSTPGTHNQAMMELGALVCLRQKPRCLLCPVSQFCAATATDNPSNIPRFKPRPIKKLTQKRIWLLHNDKLLLHRHSPNARRLRNLYELPPAEHLLPNPAPETIIARKRRAISNQQIEETIYLATWTPPLETHIRTTPSLLWVPQPYQPTPTQKRPPPKMI